MKHPFKQVDVFSVTPCLGNPVCVYLECEGLTTEAMQRIATWTNLSETTFVSESAKGDYKVRIFTPNEELPFAGHPTLGTAWALMESGIIKGDKVVQECDYGLINITKENSKIFFELPEYTIEQSIDDEKMSKALSIPVKDCKKIVTGPLWMAAFVDDNKLLNNISINKELFREILKENNTIGINVYAIKAEGEIELRTFFEAGHDIVEDPVCGSGNAAIAVHIQNTGLINDIGSRYTAFQGQQINRDGRIFVEIGDKIKIGGHCSTVFEGNSIL